MEENRKKKKKNSCTTETAENSKEKPKIAIGAVVMEQMCAGGWQQGIQSLSGCSGPQEMCANTVAAVAMTAAHEAPFSEWSDNRKGAVAERLHSFTPLHPSGPCPVALCSFVQFASFSRPVLRGAAVP